MGSIKYNWSAANMVALRTTYAARKEKHENKYAKEQVLAKSKKKVVRKIGTQ